MGDLLDSLVRDVDHRADVADRYTVVDELGHELLAQRVGLFVQLGRAVAKPGDLPGVRGDVASRPRTFTEARRSCTSDGGTSWSSEMYDRAMSSTSVR